MAKIPTRLVKAERHVLHVYVTATFPWCPGEALPTTEAELDGWMEALRELPSTPTSFVVRFDDGPEIALSPGTIAWLVGDEDATVPRAGQD